MRYAFMDNTEMKKSLLALNSEIQSVENSILVEWKYTGYSY